MAIYIDDLGDEAAHCNITKSALESRARLALRAAGIQERAQAAAPFLYVGGAVMELPIVHHCILKVQVAVRDYSQVSSNAMFKPAGHAPAVVELCQSGGLLWAEKIDSYSNMMKMVEDTIKDCLGKLDYK